MRATLLKLVFCLFTLLFLIPFKTPLLASTNNNCSCSGSTYLYYDNGGPWAFLDERDWAVNGSLFSPGPNGASACVEACSRVGVEFAVGPDPSDLCNAFSGVTYAGRQYQVQFRWVFQDFDGTSGGSADGFSDTGNEILYCPTIE